MISKKKEKNKNIIFCIACCCIGILIFHYFCHSKGEFKFLFKTANSNFGFLFVTTFFCISGFVLNYNYPKIISIKQFYYKRWKSVLVPYYICFIYFLFNNLSLLKNLIYSGHLKRLFFNIFGLDGYLLYRFKSFSLVGEWFLGAIIIIYILFPLLSIVSKGNIIINNILFFSLYFFIYKKKNFFIIIPERNIITCIFSFYFGMESFKLKKIFLDNNISFLISFLLLFIFCTIKINIKFYVLIHQIQGFCLFIVLYKVGYYAMNSKINFLFDKISHISYSIFLLHHKLIIYILSIYNPEKWHAHILLITFIIIITIISSNIHLMVLNSIFKSSLFKKIDLLFNL